MTLAIGKMVSIQTDEGSTSLGTAFAISGAVGLSAFHCIGDRATGQVIYERVEIRFPDGEEINAE